MASAPVYIARRGLRGNKGGHGGAHEVGKITRRQQLAHSVAVYYDDEVDGIIHGPESIEVFDTEDGDEFIGLYDHEGEPLYRLSERIPLGFHHRDEE